MTRCRPGKAATPGFGTKSGLSLMLIASCATSNVTVAHRKLVQLDLSYYRRRLRRRLPSLFLVFAEAEARVL